MNTEIAQSVQREPSLQAPPPSPRLHFIDGLRGLAMLMVLTFHCWLHGGAWRLDLPIGHHRLNLSAPIGLGYTGVHLFLVLSGFCLYWPFVKGGWRQPTLWEFAKRRCRRILPPYYVSMILFGGAAVVQALSQHIPQALPFLGRWFGLHALMLHNMRPQYIMSIDPPFWSLALEFQLYILFPLFVEAFRRFSATPVLLLILGVNVVFRALVAHQGGDAPELQGVLVNSVFSRCFEFALGMFAAQFVAHGYAEKRQYADRMTALLVTGSVLALAAMDGRVLHLGVVSDAKWGVLYAGLLILASRPHTLLHRILACRGLVILGISSYSVYLIHEPLVKAMSDWALRHHATSRAVIGLDFVILIPLMLGLGSLFHLLFEKPFINAPKPKAETPRQSRPVAESVAALASATE